MKAIHAGTLFITICVMVPALQSCEQSPNAKQEAAKAAIINANDQLLLKGNLDYADELFAADYAGGGPAMIKRFVSARRAAFPDLEVKIDPVIAVGDLVAWQRTNTGTHVADYAGHAPTFTKVTWNEMVFTRYNAEGKIAEEWGVSNMNEMLDAASNVNGIFQYVSPTQGQSVNRNGHFVYLFGPADGKGPMTSQAGIQTMSGDTVTNTITHATDPKQVGTSYRWRVVSFSGDTVTYNILDMNGRAMSTGRAIRIAN